MCKLLHNLLYNEPNLRKRSSGLSGSRIVSIAATVCDYEGVSKSTLSRWLGLLLTGGQCVALKC